MGTTALFAELVVGGVMTLTWLTLLAMTVLGPARVAPFLEASSLTAGFFLAMAYALGVVFDRVWDFLLDVTGLQTWVRKQARMTVSEVDRQRRRVFGADAKTAVEFVNYHRSRMRIARASLFNFLFITASGLAFLAVQHGGVGTAEFALAALAGTLLCSASALAFWKLGKSHDRVLEIVSLEQEAASPSSTGDAES